jgi:hypothetical protein
MLGCSALENVICDGLAEGKDAEDTDIFKGRGIY